MPLPKPTENDRERFWSRVKRGPKKKCWQWLGSCFPDGYGQFWFAGRSRGAHVFSFYLATGRDPSPLFVCHSCDVKSCVNPAHFFLGTNTDNLRDAVKKGRVKTGKDSWSAKHPELIFRGEARRELSRQAWARLRHRMPTCERHGMAKLTWDKVNEIRKRHAEGGISNTALGKQYGVSASRVWFIVTGRHWRV